MELNLSNIQHFSVGDGPGIRTTVFLKGCNLRCPWCHNPETQAPQPQLLRYDSLGREELCGKRYSIAQIVQEVLGDKAFYDESGGGVTISGGEPLLQAEGAAELSQALRQSGVSVLIDTAGSLPYAAFEKLNPYVNGYLFDYKTDDAEKYADIGGDLKTVRENLQRLLCAGVSLRVRVPLIPGFNTDDASVQGICGALQRLGVENVDLIPFHRMGSGKYKALGMSYAYENTAPPAAGRVEEIRRTFSDHFHTTVE